MKVKWIETEWSYGFEFIFYTEREPRRFICTDIQGGRLTFNEHIIGDIINNPTMRLEGPAAREFIQSFLDEAWEKGIRPTKEKRSREQVEKEMERLEDHLEDIRSIAFNMPPLEFRTYPEQGAVEQKPLEFYTGHKKGDIE